MASGAEDDLFYGVGLVFFLFGMLLIFGLLISGLLISGLIRKYVGR